ncbi:hypothetical protein D3C80_1063000 [compost metagenome]
MQDFLKSLLIYLPHAQRLRAVVQHLQRLVRLLQALGFHLHFLFQRLVEFGQIAGHGGKGLRQHAQLVRQCGIQREMVKVALLHTLAGVYQMLERRHYLTAHKTDAKQHQTDDGDIAHDANGGHDGQFQLGITLQR